MIDEDKPTFIGKSCTDGQTAIKYNIPGSLDICQKYFYRAMIKLGNYNSNDFVECKCKDCCRKKKPKK